MAMLRVLFVLGNIGLVLAIIATVVAVSLIGIIDFNDTCAPIAPQIPGIPALDQTTNGFQTMNGLQTKSLLYTAIACALVVFVLWNILNPPDGEKWLGIVLLAFLVMVSVAAINAYNCMAGGILTRLVLGG